jgi:hypothetical protein
VNDGSAQVDVDHSTTGGTIVLTESVADAGFTVSDKPINDYVYCLGHDTLVPPVENYAIGDKVSVEQAVSLTAGTDLVKIQGQFRQPGSLPIREDLTDGGATLTVYRTARSGVSDTTYITSDTDEFDSSHDGRSIRLEGASINNGTYVIAKGGYKYDPGTTAYVADANSALISGNGPLSGAGTQTASTAYLLGAHWRANIIFEGATVFSFDLGTDSGGVRDLLLPDLTINVSKFSGSKTIKYELELVETTTT